ncbi:unnamed protein product [Pylaiella littoralis]
MSMSQTSPWSQRTYGSVKDDAGRAPSVGRSGIWPSPNSTVSVGAEQQQQRRLGQRWRNLAAAGALAIGAATVVGFARNRQASAGASLVDVVGQKAVKTSESSAPVREARSFPKPAKLSLTPPVPTQATPAAGEELPPLSFEARNFYHIRDGKPALDYPWLRDVKLIEPHRETTLLVSSPRNGYEYIWEVRGVDAHEADLRTTASGSEAVVFLTVLDENMVTVKEVNSEGKVVRRLDEVVMVKYVRREIRTLTDEEREELLDAMHHLWDVRVDGGDGKELYGEDYADIYAISRLHFMAAMNKTCDHFHDGIGFLTNHVLITNTFEYSLQRVNPKLTLPYWDFTIEGLAVKDSADEDDTVISSPLFQDSWFGSADPDDYVVKDGRWAYSEIPTIYESNPGNSIPDVYRRQRSRWVIDSSPYMIRGLGTMCDKSTTELYPWPTCEVHFSLATSFSDWYSWAWDVLYLPHGPVHAWIGGMVNCDETIGLISSLIGKENTDSLELYAFDQRKEFWLNDFYECDGYAPTDDTSVEEILSSGQCGCQGYDLTQGDDWQTIYYNSTVAFDDVISEYDDDTKRQVVEAVCASTIYVGDNIHAGSSFDPTFWPIHPAMERLFMFSVLTGQITDMTWPDNDATSTSEELGFYGGACLGHGGGDVFPFGLLDNDPDGFEIKTGIKGNMGTGNNFTNREVLATMDANVNMLPYVYDTFKWDHCLGAGVDFDDAWVTKSGTADKTKKTSNKKSRRASSFNDKGLRT